MALPSAANVVKIW